MLVQTAKSVLNNSTLFHNVQAVSAPMYRLHKQSKNYMS